MNIPYEKLPLRDDRTMRILYDSKKKEHKTPFGCVRVGEELTLCVHIPSSCSARCVRVLFEGERCASFELEYSKTEDAYDFFCGAFCIDGAGLYFYKFHISTTEGEFDLYREGYSDTNMCEGELWQLSCIPQDFATPEPFWGAVMYQIFPDRFHRDGSPDCTDKLTPYTVHESTAELPEWRPDQNGEILNNDFFGGNLAGIAKKLDYIASLGVSVIYLNPIFKAFSNHRYDTCDYKKTDPMLGTNDDFAALCQKAHQYGIRVILDGVFSHTGSDSIYFDAKRRFGTGVMSCSDSPYKDWYTLQLDGSYESWWGIGTLPCVNELGESYIRYIITAPDSVIAHWLSLGADGFRLDVADELPDEFIALLNRRVKEIKSDAIVIGEVWEDASNKIAYGIRRKYFTGCELDSVMNYPFREAIIALVTDSIDSAEFERRIMTICENYPKEATDCLMNSLSTHDTVRIMTILSGAPLNLSREECANYVLSAAQREQARRRIFAAVMLQFFLPGCACIYYGDEIGMQGFYDPFNRAYFDHSVEENQIRDFVRAMAKLKNSHPALQKGTMHFVPGDAHTLCMERTEGGDVVGAIVNLSDNGLKLHTKKALISHGCTVTDECMYVGKYGFVVY